MLTQTQIKLCASKVIKAARNMQQADIMIGALKELEPLDRISIRLAIMTAVAMRDKKIAASVVTPGTQPSTLELQAARCGVKFGHKYSYTELDALLAKSEVANNPEARIALKCYLSEIGTLA